ncbi:MAG: response regulator transcription factor [Chloroflexi bacterium]|nr:response regulator transcription factor [Chloroflexota bacterium]MBT4004102.1 response regulator transcription factor [Chloroflexota bacterium]MBT4305783.1 response regulator transcription factor [Chloroflexota bacterium]MBT4533607.1 response regulator transcription factor [Chloroflexota bacterium]MBT4681750.1 response regulator transcription factor [Chloroflexota bacterium]
MMTTILIIEDEPELVKVLRSYLEQSSFKVITSYKGDTGLETWKNTQPDLVILDLNLPGMDGLEIAKNIRKQSNTPIIMLTARVEESDRLIGLELGADDYVTKPYSPREVVARVKAVLRRSGVDSAFESTMIKISELEIDLAGYSVSMGGNTIDLTRTEFGILATLAKNPGRVFNRLQLLEATQDGEVFEGFERNVDAHIKNLRAKIEPNPKKPIYIETVFGVGYRFSKME